MTDHPTSALPTGRIADLARNAPVVVLGYGISNRPLVDVLLGLGARVTVYDKRPLHELGEQAAQAATSGVRFTADADALSTDGVRVVFRSPGIRPDFSFLIRAREAGIEISSEMAWFLEITPATVLAITGSDGKTTTSTLTAKMLEADGKTVYLGGNIGRPLLSLAPHMTADDFVVLELSSFQLCDLPSTASPHRAAITNLSPNHLDWHTDMDDYVRAKTNIYRGARCERLVTNAKNALTVTLARDLDAHLSPVLFCSGGDAAIGAPVADTVTLENGYITYHTRDGSALPIVHKDEIRLPGVHNIENVMTAVGLCHGLVSPDAMRQVACTFGGVAHRLELVRELNGVRYYNSSIDSSPSRTAAALSALREPIVAICGGYDKKIPFEPLAQALCDRARAVVLTGATQRKIYDAILACPSFDPEALTVRLADDLQGALGVAKSLARPGEAVLLSPACASFDAFPNFEVRGETFRRLVLALTE